MPGGDKYIDPRAHIQSQVESADSSMTSMETDNSNSKSLAACNPSHLFDCWGFDDDLPLSILQEVKYVIDRSQDQEALVRCVYS